jgi:hypothetical protein
LTPREVLGLKANASLKRCRRAYRELIMQHHPDRGGDPQRFKEVQQAWDALNGKDEASSLLESRAVANLCDLFIAVVGEALSMSQEPSERDLKALMKTKLDQHRANVNKKIKEISRQRTSLGKVCGRWTSKEGATPLEDILTAKLAEADAMLAASEQELALVGKSLELLAGWEYKHDAPKQANPYSMPVGTWRVMMTTA